MPTSPAAWDARRWERVTLRAEAVLAQPGGRFRAVRARTPQAA